MQQHMSFIFNVNLYASSSNSSTLLPSSSSLALSSFVLYLITWVVRFKIKHNKNKNRKNKIK